MTVGRGLGWLLLICTVVGLGACGGELEPDDGPRTPSADGHPGMPADDADPVDSPPDGGVISDADRTS